MTSPKDLWVCGFAALLGVAALIVCGIVVAQALDQTTRLNDWQPRAVRVAFAVPAERTVTSGRHMHETTVATYEVTVEISDDQGRLKRVTQTVDAEYSNAFINSRGMLRNDASVLVSPDLSEWTTGAIAEDVRTGAIVRASIAGVLGLVLLLFGLGLLWLQKPWRRRLVG